jgi:SAM-dependent methyltransferase
VDSFYRAFEDRHRGSRELIKTRLQVYLPFIRPLQAQRADARALDLGCGRGEWLELVLSAGFHAQGVDLDEGMLAACRERGMDVQRRDALEALRSLPDASVSVVSSFHVVEHISFDDVRALIAEALRVLVPGGLLIMETPNPENIVVAGSLFYMDPSHVKPLPPALLSFAAEYAGFERVKVLRLQEPPSLRDPAAAISLLNVLEGVSPDYSVVAQKGGDEVLLADTAPAFEIEYGLTLPALAIQHAQHMEARMAGLIASVSDAREHATLAEAKAVDAHREAGEVRVALQGALREAQHEAEASAVRIAELEALVHQYRMHIEEIHASTSWRVTAPLRGLGLILQALRRDRLKVNVKRGLRYAGRQIARRPWLAKPARGILNRFPHLKLRLARIVSGLEPYSAQSSLAVPSDAVHLTPYAREIYSGLKTAVERRRKEGN